MSQAPDLYYIISSPPSRAVLMLIKSLGIKVNLKEVNILQGEQFKPEYLKLNPQHTVPVLNDNGLVIAESHAILCYLAEKYGTEDTLYPRDVNKRAIVNQRLFLDMEIFSRFLDYARPIIFEAASPDVKKSERVEEAVGFLEEFIKGHKWAAGEDISIADFALAATISNIDIFSLDLKKYPNIFIWFTKVKLAIPGYQEINNDGLEILKTLLPPRAKEEIL